MRFWILKCKIMIMKFYTELPLNLCDLCSINTQKPKHIFHFIQTVSYRKECSWEIKLFSSCNNLLMIRILNSKEKIDRWSFLLDFISFTFSQWSVKSYAIWLSIYMYMQFFWICYNIENVFIPYHQTLKLGIRCQVYMTTRDRILPAFLLHWTPSVMRWNR